MRVVNRESLGSADLHVDALYQGGRSGNAGDDPLPALLGVSNQGGFRYLGAKECPRLIVVTTTLSDPEWPDELDPETGVFTYFGDNKKPGRDLHDTPRFGNLLLRNLFDAAHTEQRALVPPVLVFSTASCWRDMVFRGLAVPGAPNLSQLEDLVAVWKLTAGLRFQNYRARFTILDVPCIPRAWIAAIQRGEDLRECGAPDAWEEWLATGKYAPLRAIRALEIRTKTEQLPPPGFEWDLLKTILDFFCDDPHGFEACAAELARMALGSVTSIDLTRPTRDGGRDAIGKYQLGRGAASITVDFAIEAKCYSPTNSVGVRELSRLISRLRHRQFGVMVTTSWVHGQAYSEIKEDGHPIIIISGGDIVRLLKSDGITSTQALEAWLRRNFGGRRFADIGTVCAG